MVDYKYWLTDNSKDVSLINNTIYHGELYSVPELIKELFNGHLLVSIKRKNYTDVKYILIHKKI
jgi:hypothetical protein